MRQQILSVVLIGMIGGGVAGFFEAIIRSRIYNYYDVAYWIAGYIYYAPIGVLCSLSIFIFYKLILLILRQKGEIINFGSLLFASTIMILTGPTIAPLFTREVGAFIALPLFVTGSAVLIITFCLFFLICRIIDRIISLTPIHRILSVLFLYCSILIVLIGVSFFQTGNDDLSVEHSVEQVNIQNKPHILFLLVDALCYDHLSCYGSDNQTPVIDNFAKEAILFSDAFSNCGWTKPSVASIMTSLYPIQHNVTTPHRTLNTSLYTMAKALQESGYHTMGFYNNYNLKKFNNFNIGFSHYARLTKKQLLPFYNEEMPLLRYLGLYRRVAEKIFGVKKSDVGAYANAPTLTKEVIKQVSENRDKRLFMYVHYMDPHEPYFVHPLNGKYYSAPTGPHDESFYLSEENQTLKKTYRDEIKYLDSSLEPLFDYLKETGLYDSTLIFFTADHGESFGEHGIWAHGPLYENLIHIPLIIKLPNSEKGGSIDSSLVQSIDFTPTILKLVGSEVSEFWEGKDIFGEEDNDYVLAFVEGPVTYNQIFRNKKEKLFSAISKGTSELKVNYYDIINDPDELKDLSDDSSYKPRIELLLDSLMTIGEKLSLKAVESTETELDEQTIKKLKALGYLE